MAVLCGGALGLERGMKHRPAGLRTYMLVCVGACVIMLTNQYAFQMFDTGDPVRMGAQVVSGIGFLGAGTIIVTRRNQIKGLTTAAGLWSAAGVGLALGIGFYEVAIVGSVAVFAVITLLQKMDNKLHRRSRQLEAYIELKDISLGDFLRTMREADILVMKPQTGRSVLSRRRRIRVLLPTWRSPTMRMCRFSIINSFTVLRPCRWN